MANPFTHRHGRRYLKDPTIIYPLPVDLNELHRQSLRTLMLLRVYGAPFCSPFFKDIAPKKVLEVACGSALWSSACHDYFKLQGYSNISFTGLDIAPLAPDLNQHGVDWRFVQHDARKHPLPFADGEFDFIFVKDACFLFTTEELTSRTHTLTESFRVLKPGGVLEVWDSDYLFRSLSSYSPKPPGIRDDDMEQAEATGTYIISSSTTFAKAPNIYLQDYNTWAQKAFEKRKFVDLPCAAAALIFSSFSDGLVNVGSRRVAIPLGEVRWEREGIGEVPAGQKQGTPNAGLSTDRSLETDRKMLTPDQAALRSTALLTVVQFIDGLEAMLKEASGKQQDEWDRWWVAMTTDLLEQNGASNGECLEVGAWWGRKITPNQPPRRT